MKIKYPQSELFSILFKLINSMYTFDNTLCSVLYTISISYFVLITLIIQIDMNFISSANN